MSVAERAYELLQVAGARREPPGLGRGAARRAPTSGSSSKAPAARISSAVRVPCFFTYDGFHNAFLDRLGDIGEQIETRALGARRDADQQAVASQYATLFQDLLTLYSRDFVAAWQRRCGG